MDLCIEMIYLLLNIKIIFHIKGEDVLRNETEAGKNRFLEKPGACFTGKSLLRNCLP